MASTDSDSSVDGGDHDAFVRKAKREFPRLLRSAWAPTEATDGPSRHCGLTASKFGGKEPWIHPDKGRKDLAFVFGTHFVSFV